MSYPHGTAQPYEEEEDGFASYKDFNNRAGPPRGAFTSSQSYDMLLADKIGRASRRERVS